MGVASGAPVVGLEGVQERLIGEGLEAETATATGSPGPIIVSLAQERSAALIALSRRSVPHTPRRTWAAIGRPPQRRASPPN